MMMKKRKIMMKWEDSTIMKMKKMELMSKSIV